MGEKGRGAIKRKRKGGGQVAGTVRSFRFHVSFLHVNSFSLYQLPIPRPSPPLCSHRLIKQQKSRTVLESQVIVGMGRNPEKNAPRGKRYLKEVPQMPAIVRLIIISHCFHLCASCVLLSTKMDMTNICPNLGEMTHHKLHVHNHHLQVKVSNTTSSLYVDTFPLSRPQPMKELEALC